MKKIGKKLIATILTATLVIGVVGVIGAQAVGTDVSAGKSWKSFSIHAKDLKTGKDDGGDNSEDPSIEKALITKPKFGNAQAQVWCIDSSKEKVEAAKGALDAKWTYGECGRINKQTASSFTFNVISTGWKAAGWDSNGKATMSEPWHLRAKKIVNVDRGRYYNVSFKIKSTLENDITTLKTMKIGGKEVSYTEKVGDKKNYTKHFHFKLYDDSDPDGGALSLQSVTAKEGGKNVLASTKDFNNLIPMVKGHDYVTVNAKVLIPSDKSDYQKKKKTASMGFMMVFGAFMKEYPDENNMHGEIEVKDFKILASTKAAGAGKAKIKKVKAGKKKLTIKYKATGAKKYQVQVALKKNFKKGLKKKTTKKKSITIKGLKGKKKYYIRVRGAKAYKKSYIYGKWSKVKTKKTKK